MLRVSATGTRALLASSTRTTSTARGFTRGVPKRFATTDALAVKAPSVSSTEKASVRDADAKFTIEPKPTKKKKKGYNIRNTAFLTLLAGSGCVAAVAYAREDREFGQQFEHYVPGARSFMQLMRHHGNSLVMALSDLTHGCCATCLPSMDPYDRIFTYPADSIEELADASVHSRPYYISTVTAATRATQTWIVTGANNCVELVGSAGKLQIWGIRKSPKFMWFCAKEHRLPFLNVDMIRYNSIDKAAIVSTDKDGLQTVTVWVFSSASRRSHYLPAGTIHPQHNTDRVHEVRWHLTEYAQTYLGIQWNDRIDIYCQERNIDGGWRLIHKIRASEFGPDKSIGSFSFTAAGNPTFSIDCRLFVYSHALQEGKTISDVAYDEHGELPLIHPFVLTELLSWGRVDAVRQLLAMLHDYIRDLIIDSSRDVALPLISMQDLLAASTDESSSHWSVQGQTGHHESSKYAALLSSGLDGDTLTMDEQLPNFGKLMQEKADYVAEKLTEVKIKGLSPIDQARLLSIVGSISASQIKDQPLDIMDIRYLIKLQLLELENKHARAAAKLSYRELN
ncbi:hypothetical protein COEREDRAFT_7359 [Coemansia reversa NRRL 1564]|uniref:RAVE complex protein Rav1 C-terminal domain-containing protein n=1 Tax=Coemansia reversa (strain ATCC 12441 / NRRL 1564) TaxID=763665 RepID=A0A2G5BEG7_COERN|nr:hypothetical protein COEREDRAFT_7359 [Coemansia reversa NRRL 1564]|eukprot:PIA17393.1 hypothetical protein COEREDRAFT_7359 [Coemansia reversa NRRL 1564]